MRVGRDSADGRPGRAPVDPLAIAERVLALAESAGADEVEAVASADEARLTRTLQRILDQPA